VRFSVLGRLEVISDDGAELRIPQPKQRALLAVLLLHANQEISVSRLIESLWEQDGPGVGPGALRTQIWALRKLLAPARRLHTGEHHSYRLEVRPGELDSAQFRQLAGQGHRAVQAEDLPVAVSCLSEALALWREPALADVPATLAMSPVAQRMLDDRAAARELLTEARLRLGQHASVIPELRQSTTADPGNERLWEQLMLALHGAGRTADALAAYQQARAWAQAELGLEPGHGLQQLHRRIPAGDPERGQPGTSPAGGARAGAGPVTARPVGRVPGGDREHVVPRQLSTAPVLASISPTRPALAEPERVTPRELPLSVPDFTGRSAQLQALTQLLYRPGRQAPGAVAISAISGTAGVGKTALAVHWAHQVADRFADGQLYANLRGFDLSGNPAAPAEVVRGFLNALGMPPEHIPPTIAAQAALYRSLIAGRQMLIVLDNARDEQQVRPLLPASQASLVIITSRNQLTGLAVDGGAQLHSLDLLNQDEAVQLLTTRIGDPRAAAEPDAVGEIARLCAHLPLALAVTAARAAAQPRFLLTQLAAELRSASGRLDALDSGDPTVSVRAVFSWSYQQLSNEAARLFRLLGLHPGLDISAPAAASLAGIGQAETARLLLELARDCLITEHAPGRYAVHDLLRACAADKAQECDSQPGRRAAIGRALDHYLHTAAHAAGLLRPDRQLVLAAPPSPGTCPERPGDHRQALAWFEAEHQVLLAAVAFAADTGAESHAWQLACAMTIYLYRRGYSSERVLVMGTALTAATRLDDAVGQAMSLRGLGSACATMGGPGTLRRRPRP
jgi:DNA-binding SARP family transcriptional activator